MSRVTLGLALHSQGGTLKTHATKLERRKRDRENRNRKSAKQSRSPSALAARAVGVATLTRQFFALGIPRHLPFRTIFDLERLDPAPAPAVRPVGSVDRYRPRSLVAAGSAVSCAPAATLHESAHALTRACTTPGHTCLTKHDQSITHPPRPSVAELRRQGHSASLPVVARGAAPPRSVAAASVAPSRRDSSPSCLSRSYLCRSHSSGAKSGALASPRTRQPPPTHGLHCQRPRHALLIRPHWHGAHTPGAGGAAPPGGGSARARAREGRAHHSQAPLRPLLLLTAPARS